MKTERMHEENIPKKVLNMKEKEKNTRGRWRSFGNNRL
jgi:hypothetical protein